MRFRLDFFGGNGYKNCLCIFMFSGSTCAALKFYCAIMSRAAKTLSSSIHTDYRAKRTAWKASFFFFPPVAACELALVSYILISASSWQTHLLHSDTVKCLQWAVNVKSFLIITFFFFFCRYCSFESFQSWRVIIPEVKTRGAGSFMYDVMYFLRHSFSWLLKLLFTAVLQAAA